MLEATADQTQTLEQGKLPESSSKLNDWLRAAGRQLLLQIGLILITVTVVFPVLWIVAMATDARNLEFYPELLILPKEFSLRAFETLLFEPFRTLSTQTKEIYFTRLLSNSLFVALGTAMLSVGLGASAAYAFSRFRFIGRQAGMLGFIVLLMMPATGTLVPLIALFSLFRIHVIFSSLAPAIFYGCIMALSIYGLNRAIGNVLKGEWVKDRRMQIMTLVGLVLLTFGIQFVGWSLLFYQSETYDEAVRQPLFATNDFRDEVQNILVDIPKREDNIERQERFLDNAQRDLNNAGSYLDEVEAVFPGAYAFVNGMNAVATTASTAVSFQEQTLGQATIPMTDVLALREVALRAEVADGEDKVADAIQTLADRRVELVEKQAGLDELRRPYLDLRSDVISEIVPYMLGTAALAIAVSAAIWGVWYVLGASTSAVELVRKERFQRIMMFFYIGVVALIAFGWFRANYTSPTEEAGLEGGGLWYDIKIAFRGEDEILDDLQPYDERVALEVSAARLEEVGLDAYRTDLETKLAAADQTIADLQALNTDLDVPDGLSRPDEIDWKDDERDRIKGEINEMRSNLEAQFDSRQQYQQVVGDSNRLDRLNNENLRTTYLGLVQDYRGVLDQQLALIADGEDTDGVLAAFDAKLATYPSDAAEEDRLRKELAVRSANAGNVTETLKITLFGLMIAYSSGALPFAIWNLKGYFDTIPKELEEAALVDGANLITTFFRVILPLALPALAITTLFGFMTGWTEFILAVQFLSAGDVERTTLAIALRGIAGGGATQAQPDYTEFAAMSVLMAIPVIALFYIFQRWIVSGLTVGGVKG